MMQKVEKTKNLQTLHAQMTNLESKELEPHVLEMKKRDVIGLQQGSRIYFMHHNTFSCVGEKVVIFGFFNPDDAVVHFLFLNCPFRVYLGSNWLQTTADVTRVEICCLV